MVHGSIDYDLEHLTRCHRVFFWSFCIIFCSFHNIIIHPEPFFAKNCHRLGNKNSFWHRAWRMDSCICNGIGFRRFIGCLWYKEQMLCRLYSGSEFSANGVSINVRKLSSKTQVVCSLYHRSHACCKNMAADSWGRAVFGDRFRKLENYRKMYFKMNRMDTSMH